MTGHAVVRDGDGNDIRANCSATRENETSNHFNWRCAPADSQAAAAPAEAAEAGDEGGK
jgi:hypothetical protein